MAQRKLAAIMFSDIVGYASLLKEDEKKAFEILRKNQRIHKRLIKKFKGRWLKEMESGTLASFSSIIDAVMCALSIQKATEELEIPVRIGIHLGEVIFEKSDVLGDGVNIASRIQNAVSINGIVISETVYNDIRNKEGLEVEFLGEQALKGVSKPVGIYKVNCSDDSPLDFTIDTGELVRPLSFGRATIVVGILVIALLAYALYYFLPKRDSLPEPEKSILVLPPDNYTGTDTLDFLVAGIHDALITSIGRISALRVISRTSARAYYNPDKSLKEMATDAGVDVVVKPSVTCGGDTICLNVQMFNPDDEGQPLFDQEYNEDKSQIFNLYNTITKIVSDEINVNLRPQEEILLAEYRMVDPDAYDAYVKGKLYLDQINPKSLSSAIVYFNKAIEIDPDWAPPYAGLVEVGAYQKQMGFVSKTSVDPLIYRNLIKVIELDPNSAITHYTKAVISVWTEYDWKKVEEEFLKALELNPSDALYRMLYAHLLLILGRSEEALYQSGQAFELDPRRAFVLALYGMVLLNTGEYEIAFSITKEALSYDPDNYFAPIILANTYHKMGNYEAWFELWSKTVRWKFDDDFISNIEKVLYEKGYVAVSEAIINEHEKIFRQGGASYNSDQVGHYLIIKNYDRAMDYFEIMYEKDDPDLPYLGTHATNFPDLKDNPRYIALLRKMNLPVD